MYGQENVPVLKLLSKAVESGEASIRALVFQAMKSGLSASDVLNQGLLPGIERVGEKFARGELFIPEVMFCARVLQEGIDTLRPHLQKNTAPAMKGKLVLGTVAGDIHDLGKNLVKMMFTAHGYEVVDLGVDVAPEKFAAATEEHRPDFIGLSALLTTTMAQMEKIIKFIEERDLRKNGCLIMVGGAPVTAEFAGSIGADIYADNAVEAVELVKKGVRG